MSSSQDREGPPQGGAPGPFGPQGNQDADPGAHGYGLPPEAGQGHAPPHSYGAPAGPVAPGHAQGVPRSEPPTVSGVPLHDGERVIYFHRTTLKDIKLSLWTLVVGFIGGAIYFRVRAPHSMFMPVFSLVCGAFSSVGAILVRRWNRGAEIVTTQRFISVNPKGRPTSLPLAEAVDLMADRDRGVPSGNLIALAGIVLMAGVNKLAERSPKLEPDYWTNTNSVVVVSRSGERFALRTENGEVLNPFTVRCVLDPGFASAAPAVPYLP